MFEAVRELLHTSESTPLSSFTVKRRLVDKRGTRIEVAENGNKSISECTCQEYTPCYYNRGLAASAGMRQSDYCRVGGCVG
jgi:hypothetical protein